MTKNSDYIGKNIKLILGSENNILCTEYRNIINSNPDIILSLDFNKDGLINNSYLLDKKTKWPKKVIVMMLHLVGTNSGFDEDLITNILEIKLLHCIVPLSYVFTV